jgi:D-lyxose ketol-isomerase
LKRSEINQIMRSAEAFIRERGFYLPPFAYWTPETWSHKGKEVREIMEAHLGWDITDFGSGDYLHCGLFLFTMRNGLPGAPHSKPYAEKIMIVEVGQVTPMHFHWNKMEDIINRGGGQLAFRLYNATPDEELAETDVVISMDGIQRTVPAGGMLKLSPGESLTLPQRCYHEFWGEGRRVLVGEVSSVNDDQRDNRFYEPMGRFPEILEDEAPLYLLCSDYERYYEGAR